MNDYRAYVHCDYNPIASISANVIDRSRPLVLSAIAAGETIDKFKKIRRYYREAKQSEGGKKS